jgi:hypothetical protein
VKALAIGCWVAAWCVASVATAAVWAAIRRHDGGVTVTVATVTAAALGAGAAGLAYIGAALW